MTDFLIINARLLTLAGDKQPRRGSHMGDLGVIELGHLLVRGDKIAHIGEGIPSEDLIPEGEDIPIIDAFGRVVMPTFVDCHTHICWAGERFDEFEMGIKGASYLEILESGGGIMSTVRAVREASQEDLTVDILSRIGLMSSLGTASVEIKSGYGLDTENELKMLRAIHDASQDVTQQIAGTFLGAHAIAPGQPNFVETTIHETLPSVVQEFPGITCDAYCEKGAWSIEDTTALFKKAIELGCPFRVHVDQFNALGMLERAIELGAKSVDHLEHSTDEGIKTLARSDTIGVLLPVSGFCLNDAYARGRFIVDSGCAVAIATNFNPGSAQSPSMPFAISLACRRLGLTPAEAITAATYNAACVLGIENQVGSLEVGKKANLQLLEFDDERQLAWEVATGGPLLVSIDGEVIHLLTDGGLLEEEP